MAGIASETAKSAPARGEGQVVPSVLRAGRILDELASGEPRATLASLSLGLGIPRSSTLALCNSLVEIGLLARDPDGLYRLGPHTLELSRAFLGQTDFHSEFQRAVPELGVLPEQTLVCAVLRGRDVVYIGRRPGTSPLGVSYEIGMRLPAHCTATGLSILGSLPEAEVGELYEGAELEQLTARSLGTFEGAARATRDGAQTGLRGRRRGGRAGDDLHRHHGHGRRRRDGRRRRREHAERRPVEHPAERRRSRPAGAGRADLAGPRGALSRCDPRPRGRGGRPR